MSDAKANSGKRCDSNSGMSICDNNGSDASAAEGAAAHGASASASPNTAASSGYTSLNNHPHGEFELDLGLGLRGPMKHHNAHLFQK